MFGTVPRVDGNGVPSPPDHRMCASAWTNQAGTSEEAPCLALGTAGVVFAKSGAAPATSSICLAATTLVAGRQLTNRPPGLAGGDVVACVFGDNDLHLWQRSRTTFSKHDLRSNAPHWPTMTTLQDIGVQQKSLCGIRATVLPSSVLATQRNHVCVEHDHQNICVKAPVMVRPWLRPQTRFLPRC